MTELEYIEKLRSTVSRLCRNEIDVCRFEEICIGACTQYRGPPPDGREYVVSLVENRVIVGHVERESASNELFIGGVVKGPLRK